MAALWLKLDESSKFDHAEHDKQDPLDHSNSFNTISIFQKHYLCSAPIRHTVIYCHIFRLRNMFILSEEELYKSSLIQCCNANFTDMHTKNTYI